MEEKYYIPEIEEFHVGFEYEDNFAPTCDVLTKVLPPYKYEKQVFKIDKYLYLDKRYIEYGGVRVKFLDKSDIESLGWKNYIPPREYNHQWTLDNWKLNVWFNTEIPIVRIENYPIFFQSSIKNKSEFKKLMKLLNIV